MTELRPLTWDDLDQLADFTAGTLTGPDADRITHLIATDPRWTTAHTTLHHTEPTIRAALRAAADTTPPIPDQLTTTLDYALRTTAHDRPAPRGPGRTRPLPHHPPARPLASRPARRRRPLLIGLATVLVFACGVGGTAATVGGLFTRFATETAQDAAAPPLSPTHAPANGLPTPPDAESSVPYLYASGSDYTQDTLTRMAATAPGFVLGFDVPELRGGPLARLGTLEGFDDCVAAVRGVHPGQVVAGDFAEYEGGPALILRLAEGSVSVVVAVGPECGRDGDPHELASAQTG